MQLFRAFILAAAFTLSQGTAVCGVKGPLPEPLQKYFTKTNYNDSFYLNEALAIKQLPSFISALASSCSALTNKQTADIIDALLCDTMLSKFWEPKTEVLSQRCATIKKCIADINDEQTRNFIEQSFKIETTKFLWDFPEKFELLIQLGADPKTLYGKHKKTLLHSPWWLNKTGVNTLVNMGLDPKAQDKKGRTPIEIAIARGEIDGFNALLNHKVSIHRFIGRKNSCVHAAIARAMDQECQDYTTLFTMLFTILSRGIAIDLPDNAGKTILERLIDSISNSNFETKRVRSIFNLLMGQQPQQIPFFDIAFFDHEELYSRSDNYKKFLAIKNESELKKWLSGRVNLAPRGTIALPMPPAPLIFFGDNRQLKECVKIIAKKFKKSYKSKIFFGQSSEENFNDLRDRRRAFEPSFLYAQYLSLALEWYAEMGTFRLLSLCAQQGIAKPWMLEKNAQDHPLSTLQPHKDLQKIIVDALTEKKCVCSLPYMKAAFASVGIQNKLMAIVCKKQYNGNKQQRKLKNIEDVKIVFKWTVW